MAKQALEGKHHQFIQWHKASRCSKKEEETIANKQLIEQLKAQHRFQPGNIPDFHVVEETLGPR
jgi:hypothetical protein